MSVALHPANARRAAAAPPSAGEGAATVAHAVEGKDIDAKMAAAVVRDARQGGASELSIEQCTVLGPGQVLAVVDTSCIATVRICNSVIASGANGTAQSRPSEGAQAGSVRELTLDECGFAPGFLSLADLYRELSGLKSLTFRRSKLEAPPAPGPRGDQRSPVALLARPLALGYCAHLQRVEIGWCSLGTTGTSAVLQQLHLAVSSSPAHMCVREIALPGNGAGDACVPSLAQLLCGPVGRTLRVLDLTSNELTSTGMDTLASRLLQGCRQALGLHVFRCGFNPMGSAALRGIFLCMSVCEHMSEVALPGCELGPEGAPELASGVQSVLMLRTLDLSQNAIGDAGLAQVFKVWQGCESPRGSRADRGGSDSYETSSSGYTSSESESEFWACHLDEIILAQAGAGRATVSAIARLAPLLHSPLRVLRLTHAAMSRATALALVESLHPHVNPIQNGLRVLDLSWCSGCLSDAAGPTLLSGLAAHPRLEELRLTKTGIAADAAQELGVMVACLPGLRVLELSWNDIGDDGAAAVARAAGSAPRRERGAERELRELLLYSCGITDVGAAALTEHLRSGASRGGARLEALDVSFNSIGKGAVAALLAAVEEGGRLRTFASEGAVEECGTCGTKDCGSCAPLLGDW